MERFFKPRRWGDNDRYFGPFTLSRDSEHRHVGIVLSSTDDEGRGCKFRISGFGWTFIVALPSWALPPERRKIFPNWDEKTIQRLGRNWYWDIIPREFGVTVFEGHLSVSYGRKTYDSSTEQRWGCFLPWTQWRHVRHSLYGLDGSLYAHLPNHRRYDAENFEASRRIADACPTVRFAFKDYDGEELTARTKIEEREWLRGEGWFKWLSWFYSPNINRSLDIQFSGETGKRKGSWKGGTLGHGIAMFPGELHAEAFKRYCSKHDMTFMGPTLSGDKP